MAVYSRSNADHYAPEHLSWWTRFAAYNEEKEYYSKEDLELIRRSRLAGWMIFTSILCTVLLIPLVGDDPIDLIIVVTLFGTEGITILLNRRGWVSAAGTILLIVVLLACLSGPLLVTGGYLSLDELTDFDLMSIAVVMAASILPLVATWIVLFANVVLIGLVYFLLPHGADLAADLTSFPSVTQGIATLLTRPIVLSSFVALITVSLVHGLNQTADRYYAARHWAQEMTDVANAMWATAEQKTLANDYSKFLNDALVACLQERRHGVPALIELNFAYPPRDQFELGQCNRILSEAQRINLAFKSVDSDATQTQFRAEQFDMVVHQICWAVADTLQDGDVNRLHSKKLGTTGYPQLDVLGQLTFAFGLKAEVEQIYHKTFAHLPHKIDYPDYLKTVVEAALNAFRVTPWIHAQSAPGAGSVYGSAGSPTPPPHGAVRTPSGFSSQPRPPRFFEQSDPRRPSSRSEPEQSALYTRQPGGQHPSGSTNVPDPPSAPWDPWGPPSEGDTPQRPTRPHLGPAQDPAWPELPEEWPRI